MSLCILSLDVSLVRTGLAVLVDGSLTATEVIETKDGWPRYQRLAAIYGDVAAYCALYSPDVIVIETSVRFGKQSRDSRNSVEALAQARGAALAGADHWIREHKATIVEVDPCDVKWAICGSRQATKAQVAANLRLRGFDIPTMSNGRADLDVSDAAGAGLYIYLRDRLETLAREQGHLERIGEG